MTEACTLKIGERAARCEDLVLEIVARFEGDLRLPQDRQASRIRLGRRRIIGQSEKCAAHGQRSCARIAKIELETGERLDVRVLRRERQRKGGADSDQK